MYICSIGKLNEESVSSGSEWVRISTRDDEYNKGMNGMNSTKVSDIEDQMNGHAHICIHRVRGGEHGTTIVFTTLTAEPEMVHYVVSP